jgi:membrane-associated protease RseP (regulator of RpoE activity)
MKRIITLVLASMLASLLAGCASEKNKTVLQRGWIGGDYVLAKHDTAWVRLDSSRGVSGTLPKSMPADQKAAIEITSLTTNAPARAAGLRSGDFVMELNHQPVTSLRTFRRTIDRSAPGSLLPVKVYRNGQFTEFQVSVGREKYRSGGNFSLVLPTAVHRWDLWPNPGFSLVCVGYEPNPGLRHDLGKSHDVYDENWSAYLGFIELSCGKRVMAQESVTAGHTE